MKKRNILLVVLAGSLTYGAAMAAQPGDKGPKEKIVPTIDNYFVPTTGLDIYSDIGYVDNVADIPAPRDFQFFVTGNIQKLYTDTAEDVEVNGASIVQKEGKGKNQVKFINDFDQYTGKAVVVTKGKDKFNNVEIYEARTDLEYTLEMPDSTNNCPEGTLQFIADYVHPETDFPDRTGLSKVNSVIYIFQATSDGDPIFPPIAGGNDTNDTSISACVKEGYSVIVAGIRSIQDAYTTETVDLSQSELNFTLPGYRFVGLDLDKDGIADKLDANQDGFLDGLPIGVGCTDPFPNNADIIMDPPVGEKAYTFAKGTDIDGLDIIAPNTISYHSPLCENPGLENFELIMTDGEDQKNMVVTYQRTNP